MREFVNYNEIMRVLNLSTHRNQLEKKAARFPDHFVEIDGLVYVSCEYIDALCRYKEAERSLNRLRKGGIA